MANANQRPLDGPLYRAASEATFMKVAAAEVSRSTTDSSALEVKQVECECCGLSEECTPGYIARVKELFCGRWVCGLCAEAVKEERHRMGRGTAMEDALRAHMNVCARFNKLEREKPVILIADAMRQLLRRNLGGPPGVYSKPNSPRGASNELLPRANLSRSSSCIPALANKEFCSLPLKIKDSATPPPLPISCCSNLA